MIRRPPRSTQSRSSAASDVYKRQVRQHHRQLAVPPVDIHACERSRHDCCPEEEEVDQGKRCCEARLLVGPDAERKRGHGRADHRQDLSRPDEQEGPEPVGLVPSTRDHLVLSLFLSSLILSSSASPVMHIQYSRSPGTDVTLGAPLQQAETTRFLYLCLLSHCL